MVELQQLVLSILQDGLQQTQAAYAAVSSSNTAEVSAGHSNYIAGLLLSATEQNVEQVGRHGTLIQNLPCLS
jgi:hypothetical protein